jgi:hypothetical protein
LKNTKQFDIYKERIEPDDFGSKIKQKKGIKRKIEERTVAGDDDGEESIKISC